MFPFIRDGGGVVDVTGKDVGHKGGGSGERGRAGVGESVWGQREAAELLGLSIRQVSTAGRRLGCGCGGGREDGSGTGGPGQDRAAIAVGIQVSTGPPMALPAQARRG